MKKVIMISLVSLALSSLAMASTKKICFGSTKSEETKGAVLAADINAKEITIKSLKGDYPYNDSYPATNSTVKGRDGKTYLEFKGENSGEYQDYILVDKALLKESTTGLLQIRARGEGYFSSVFVCKDDLK